MGKIQSFFFFFYLAFRRVGLRILAFHFFLDLIPFHSSFSIFQNEFLENRIDTKKNLLFLLELLLLKIKTKKMILIIIKYIIYIL